MGIFTFMTQKLDRAAERRLVLLRREEKTTERHLRRVHGDYIERPPVEFKLFDIREALRGLGKAAERHAENKREKVP